MERTIVVIPGLFGGVSKKHYRPLAEMFGSEDFLLFRAGADWEPMNIAEQINCVALFTRNLPKQRI